ncbi:hypothetical protein LIER_23769 [Lithospermum erythrorhizon]|uniref:Uncharacterized protein n=1 Tax=Lithospermum erythrorhizon TaxID=34254 RepID=A0AAV3R4E2_LITER
MLCGILLVFMAIHTTNIEKTLGIQSQPTSSPTPTSQCFFVVTLIRNDNLIYEKLDQAMGNYEWLDSFSTSSCVGLPIQRSDHGPLIISTKNDKSSVPRPFRLEYFLTPT